MCWRQEVQVYLGAKQVDGSEAVIKPYAMWASRSALIFLRDGLTLRESAGYDRLFQGWQVIQLEAEYT